MNDNDLKKLRDVCSESWVGGRSPAEVEASRNIIKIEDAIYDLHELLNLAMNEQVSSIVIEKLKAIITLLEEE
jgi:hypothetical protein